MVLRLPDKWVWDFWLAQDGLDYHIFYLQAPRSLGDPELRHWHVSIGHAVSQDLRAWRILPDALHPGPSGAWDDYTTWTGSVIRHAGVWYLFYTGCSRAEGGAVQRIGLATSLDLINWEKHPHNPLITADSRWYEVLDQDLRPDQAWRDPWVFRLPQNDTFHALITARANEGPLDGRGVIAHAQSNDLIHWEVLPPVTEPGDFYHLEVPQLIAINHRYYLIFCTAADTHSLARRQRTGLQLLTGIHYLVADDSLGPFRFACDPFLVGDATGSLYAGKCMMGPQGQWLMLATRMFADDGSFIGELSDPMPVAVDSAGLLSVDC